MDWSDAAGNQSNELDGAFHSGNSDYLRFSSGTFLFVVDRSQPNLEESKSASGAASVRTRHGPAATRRDGFSPARKRRVEAVISPSRGAASRSGWRGEDL